MRFVLNTTGIPLFYQLLFYAVNTAVNKISVPSQFIYRFDSHYSLAESVLIDIKSKIKQQQIHWSDTGENSSQSGRYGYITKETGIEMYFHSELFQWITDCVNQAAKDIFKDLNFGICDAWITRSNFGQGSGIHSHEWSIISAVYYPQDCSQDTGGDIMFWPENQYKEQYSPFVGPDSFKEITVPIKITPQCGQLLVFPSYLQHSMSRIKKVGFTRYSVAINAIPQGSVSKRGTAMLKLKLEK